MNAIAALMLIVAGQDAAVPEKPEATKVEAKVSEAANAPLDPDFEYYFKRADENKLDLIRQSGDKAKALNSAFARAQPSAKARVKAEIEFEKEIASDLRKSEAFDWMPTSPRKGDIGRLPKVGVIWVINDEALLVVCMERGNGYAVAKVASTAGFRDSSGVVKPIGISGMWQAESMDGREYAGSAGRPTSVNPGKNIPVLVRIDNAAIRQQREAYVASKKKPK